MNQCSDNCNLTRVCDKLTGQCEGGCIPGWRGATCNDSKHIICQFVINLTTSRSVDSYKTKVETDTWLGGFNNCSNINNLIKLVISNKLNT